MNAAARGFDPRSIRLVVFDLVGTVLSDAGTGPSVVTVAFLDAFREAGIPLAAADVTNFRGLDKREAVELLLRRHGPDPGTASPERVDRLARSVVGRIEQGLELAREIEGTSATLHFLRGRNVRVALGSGLPLDLVHAVASRVGWIDGGLVDCVTSADVTGRGRPHPAMIHDAMTRLAVDDPAHVLKVGDTVADVEEGKNAGVWTVAVLTGSQPRALLEGASPDFILPSVAEIRRLFR